MRVKIEFSAGSLFGDTDQEGYDVEASAARFIELLETRLCEEYADVEIVQSINDRVMVNGMTDHDEVPWVNQAMEQVWSSWDWLVSCEGEAK